MNPENQSEFKDDIRRERKFRDRFEGERKENTLNLHFEREGLTERKCTNCDVFQRYIPKR